MIEYHREITIYIDEEKMLEYYNEDYNDPDNPRTMSQMIYSLENSLYEWDVEELISSVNDKNVRNGAFVGYGERDWIEEK